MIESAGEADKEKSARETDSESETLSEPLVPVTVKFKELVVTPRRLLTVSVALSPGAIEAGLKTQLAGKLPEQARLILPANPNWLEAEMMKFVESAPLITTAELPAAESW